MKAAAAEAEAFAGCEPEQIMTRRTLVAVAALCAVGPAASLQAQGQPWVVAAVSGRDRVSFRPQPEPYTAGGPAVSVPVAVEQDLKLASGESVEGFEFIGWHEGTKIRVVVRALVPGARDGGRELPPENERFGRRQVATLLLTAGPAIDVPQLRELGAPPVTLRVVAR